MLDCKLCHEWSYSSLCQDCEKIENLYKIYGKEKVLEILDKVMVIQKLKDDKKPDPENNDDEVD
jgi:hypothetical protein